MLAPFKASEFADDGKYHLLLAASGSVATIKLPNIIRALAVRREVSIRVILTESSKQFLQAQSDEQPHLESLRQLPNVDGIYLDEDEWRKPWVRGDAILHIELRRWAHDLFIAPLSANTLAKLAWAMSDNLLTSVVRAWEVVYPRGKSEPVPTPNIDKQQFAGPQKGIYIAPAMNTAMWVHPATEEHLGRLLGYATQKHTDSWITVLRPQEKALACGDTGSGAMCDWQEIVDAINFCADRRLAAG